MKKTIQALNRRYDSLKEPRRLYVFLLAVLCPFLTLNAVLQASAPTAVAYATDAMVVASLVAARSLGRGTA